MELDIFSKGKEYISAAEAAKKIGYASDYIGQLCRAKKVPGKLIGRTWYVDLPSLLNHRKTRQLGKRKSILKNLNQEISTKNVEVKPAEILYTKPLKEIVLKYESEIGSRLPELLKPRPLTPPLFTSKLLLEATLVTCSLVFAISAGFGTLNFVSPSLSSNLEGRIGHLSSTVQEFAKDFAHDTSATQLAASETSLFGFFSHSVEFLIDSFDNLREFALRSLAPLGMGRSSTQITLNTPSNGTSQALSQTSTPLDIKNFKSDLKSELEAYVRTELARTPAPQVVYNTSPTINNTVLRQEILLADTRPSITRQSTADVDALSRALARLDSTVSSISGASGNLNPGFTLGSVAFQGASGLTEDNANFFWDDTNNRLGIGTTTPQWKLNVAGTAAPQLTLSDSGLATSNHWSLRNSNGTLYFATSSPTTFATSTIAALTIDGTTGNISLGNGSFLVNGSTTLQNFTATNSTQASTTVSTNFLTSNATTTNLFVSGLASTTDIRVANSALFGGSVGIGTAVPTSNALVTLNNDTTTNWVRALYLTNTSNSAQNSNLVEIADTATHGTLTSTHTYRDNLISSTPTATVQQGGTFSFIGTENNFNVGSLSMGNSSLSVITTAVYGTNNVITGNIAVNDTDGTGGTSPVFSAVRGNINAGSTVTAAADGMDFLIKGGDFISNFTNTSTSGGAGVVYGVYTEAGGTLDSTTGNLRHMGVYSLVSGTAKSNYGLNVEVGGATSNYGIYITSPTVASTNYAIYSAASAQSYFAGYVGIGTSSPSHLLTVASSTAVQLTLSAATASTNHFSFRNAGGILYIATSSPTTFATSTTAALTIDGTTGNVGIGINAPTSALEVATAASASLTIDGNSSSVGSGLTINDKLTSGNSFISLVNPTGTANSNFGTVPSSATFQTGNNTSGGLIFVAKAASSPIIFATGGSTFANERLRIDGTGLVGIGTTTPNGGHLVVASSTGAQILLTDGVAGSNPFTFRQIGSTLYVATSSQTSFATSTAVSLAIDGTTGSIGIGTSTPRWRLTVADTNTPQFTLADSGLATSNRWSLRNSNGILYFATSSPTSFATSTTASLTLDGTTGSARIGGSLIAADGSVSAPSIVFNSETDLGFYRTAANNIALAYGGSNRIRFGADLTFQPSTVLQWGSSGFTSPDLRLTRNASGKLNLDNGSVGVGFDFGTAGVLKIRTTAQTGDASLTALNVIASNSIGVGTTTPSYLLTLASSTAPQLALTDASSANNPFTFRNIGNYLYIATATPTTYATSSVTILAINPGGNVGIGQTNPQQMLTLSGSLGLQGIGNGAGTAYLCTTLATGVVSTSTSACNPSSLKYKENVNDLGYGLAQVMALRPVSYNYKPELLVPGHQIGFIAEEVYQIVPEVVGLKDGQPDNIDYAKLTSLLVKAVQEVVQISGDFRTALIAWFGNTANGIGDFFANRVHTKELCVSDEGGETCINRAELNTLLSGAGMGGTVTIMPPPSDGGDEGGGGDATSTPEATEEPQPEPAPELNPEPPPDNPPAPESTP